MYPHHGLTAQLTPVVLHQNEPVAVQNQPSIFGIIGLVCFSVVMVTHWIACIVFLVFMYRLDAAATELQKNFNQLGF